MSTARMDSKRRIVLPVGKPGDVFDIHRQADGRMVLVRLERPETRNSMSQDACLAAMRDAPLRPAGSWEQLRQITREP